MLTPLNENTAIRERAENKERRNEAWLIDLASSGSQQAEALEELRVHLVRAAKIYLGRQRNRHARLPMHEFDPIAEEVAQESILKILNKLHTFQGKSKFTTWAMKVAINTAASELRRRYWQDMPLTQTDEDGAEYSLLTPQSNNGHERNPELVTQRKEVIDKLREIIQNELTERQRTVILNVLVHGMPLEVIAKRLNTNRNNLYKITHDARLKLKQALVDADLPPAYALSLFAADG